MTHRLAASLQAALAVWMLACSAIDAHAQQEPPRTSFSSVRVGFAGSYKVGYWTPVAVTLRGGADAQLGYIELTLPDGDGIPTKVRSEQPVQTRPSSEQQVLLYAKFGQTDGQLTARFIVDGDTAASRRWDMGVEADEFHIPYPLNATDELIVTLGPSLGVASATQRPTDWEGPQVEVAQLTGAADLPTRWYGYEGVDAVVLATSNPQIFRQLSSTSARAAALQRWIKLGGGQLVVCVGREAEEILAPGSLLAGLVPGKFDTMIPLRRTTVLESYVDTTSRIDVDQQDFRLDVPRLIGVQGNIEVYEGQRPEDLPLVIRSAVGFGEIITTTVDLDKPPFLRWSGRPLLVNKLLGRRTASEESSDENPYGAVSTLGYGELVGQLRSALDQFPGVRVVPFAAVAALVFGYVLLIGPIDYWLVKRVIKRMEATWVTFPLWVVLVSATAYYGAYWFKGRELRTNQVELVDVDVENRLVRGTTWSNIFSPRPDSYNLSLQPELPNGEAPAPEDNPKVLFSWLGLPGDALGGMSGGGGGSLFSQSYAFSPQLDALSKVPIQVWSTKGFTSRWHASADLNIEADLSEDQDQMLSGTIYNGLGTSFTEALLFYDRWAYQISRFDDGKQLAVDETLRPLLMTTLLTKLRIVGEQDMATAYDTDSHDVPRILEMMMFHAAAGGKEYTGELSNRYQSFCDLSDQLRLGRAMLVVKTRNNGSRLLRDGEPITGDAHQRWTVYRFVFPVKRNNAAR